MDIVTILIAIGLILIAWKVATGVIKYGLIALVIAAAIWFMTQGGFG
ncbi:hypothetical protein [Qipengyuania sediminis]|nr:hypothetical protein [Qipengyuania sediminis]